MVALLPKAQIESLNIDTVEKAIVFGALALRAALVGSDNAHAEDRTVVIGVRATGETSAILSLDLSLPYNSYEFNTNGGLLLDSIQELTANSLTLDTDLDLNSEPSPSGLTIPDYPETIINTWEKYLLYYCNILWASIANKRDSTISFTLLGNQEEPQILIRVVLPLDLDSWLLGNNYLNSISTVVNDYQIPEISPSFIPDSSLITTFYVTYNNIQAGAEYELLTVFFEGLLTQIRVEADLPDSSYFYDISFYFDGVEAVPDNVTFEGGSVAYLYYDEENPDIYIAPGTLVTLIFYGEQPLTLINLEITILNL